VRDAAKEGGEQWLRAGDAFPRDVPSLHDRIVQVVTHLLFVLTLGLSAHKQIVYATRNDHLEHDDRTHPQIICVVATMCAQQMRSTIATRSHMYGNPFGRWGSDGFELLYGCFFRCFLEFGEGEYVLGVACTIETVVDVTCKAEIDDLQVQMLRGAVLHGEIRRLQILAGYGHEHVHGDAQSHFAHAHAHDIEQLCMADIVIHASYTHVRDAQSDAYAVHVCTRKLRMLPF
jgi:hypothetical protein